MRQHNESPGGTPVPSIVDLIERLEDELGTITQRLFVLEAFGTELDRVTRGKPFRIWGSAVWMMILDSRDAHVTHLASWLKSQYSKGGFFGQLRAHHLRAVPRKWKPQGRNKHSPQFAKELEKQHNTIFARLFPNTTGICPGAMDVANLQQQFILAVQHVVADRDANRAHPYEKSGTASSSAKQLDFKELRACTTFVESWLNDLRQLSIGSTFAHSDMNFQSPSALAEELVDAVLLGSQARAQLLMGGADRHAYYDDLHVQHSALGAPAQILFNDERRGRLKAP